MSGMDFFAAQDAARKRTHLLVGLYALAIVAIIAIVYVVAHIGLGAGPTFSPGLLALVGLGVIAVVLIGTGIRTASLRKGGPAVAELLGARRIQPNTSDPDERRLVNIVEEMALASGTPVPAIYVMDREEGINAFAAGYTTHDAAVAVTRGALLTLNRDELQGVMAHEFSHILNGDMRLNIRLIGVLYGILLLAVVGRGIVYAGPRGRSRGGQGGGGGWIILVGLALLIVGYVGVFFGKIIKAAVSRQREYLADSAAVQFTRNPDGLAGALKKIGAQSAGSRIEDHHAEELSHLFFANGVRSAFGGALATHPPLKERIKRIDPSWDGNFKAVTAARTKPAEHRKAARRQGFEPAALAGMAAMASIGAPGPSHLAYASELIERFPRELLDAAHDGREARALVLALALAEEDSIQDAHRAVIREYGGLEVEGRVTRLLREVKGQGREARLPLVDLSLPAIGALPPDEKRALTQTVERLMGVDGRVRMFEFALLHVLKRYSADEASKKRGRVSASDLRSDAAMIVSAVVWAGGDETSVEGAFAAAMKPFKGGEHVLVDRAALSLSRIDDALDRFEGASMDDRRRLLEACGRAAEFDGVLQVNEAELLRAISEAIDCPMPPMITGKEQADA
jgi:Zn-dependent protease with chaperone function